MTAVVVTPPMLSVFQDVFALLEAEGMQVIHNQGDYPMPAAQLATCIGSAPVAIVGLDEVNEALFAACPHLRVIARNGVGLDNVDLEAANRHGVLVTAPLGANSTSVAELAIGLMLSLLRHVVVNHNAAQQNIWQRIQGQELAGKTLGIIGLGRIGKKVATRALGMEMQVIAHDIAPDEEFAQAHGIRFVERDDLLAQSDIVSLHVPLTVLTYQMINADSIAQMKSGAFLINTARGPVVDAAALAAGLDQGHVAGAALDVYTVEGQVDAALLGRANVVTTTHMGAYTQESLYRTTLGAVNNILELMAGQRPAGLINPEIWRDHDRIFPSHNDLIAKSLRK